MRFSISWKSAAVAALCGAALSASLGPASAGGRSHDRVHADSFGNLIVQSSAGYKRIIVGEGRLAKQLQAYTSGGEADEAYGETRVLSTRAGYYVDDCYRPPVLLKGRSYMYGLDEGVIPEPSGRCPAR